MVDLVLEKIIDSINELGFAKWIVLIVMALTPVIIDIYYKSVNSKYYNVVGKYFNFSSLKKLIAYTCLFIFVILNFTFLFYDLIIHFSLEGAIIYLVLLSILCIGIVIYIFNYMVRIDVSIKCLIPILIIGILIISILMVFLFHNFTFKCAIILVICILGIIIAVNKILKCKNIKCKNKKNSIYIFINPILFFILSLLSISLISCLIFADEINENLNNRIAKQSETKTEINTKTNTVINQYKDLSEGNNQNDNSTKEYLNYVLKNSGDLKFNEFVTLFKNPKDLIRLDIDYESSVEKSQLQQNLDEFFSKIKDAHIEKELYTSMRLLIILNLLLDPIIFIFAMASIFILTAALLLLLRNRFFNPKKIKIYEYIDKPGLMKEVVITEYKDKLLVMEGLIYQENLYLMRSNYRIIDILDTEIFAQKTFKSVVVDMLDFVIPASIIDCNSEEIKCSFDISLNLEKEAINIKNLEYDTRGIDIICDVIFKNGRMIIKSEIKHILETIYGINNFKFKLDESVKKNFSIDEYTGEIIINLDLE
ncbi:hypothetical protein C7381_101162 [Ezakiella coagulans]|uniref:Uncharacterized protein n=1 Tax=Ezakiella coagulans TaxID=46507 RepID=A0A2U1E6R3_9FIRM|nr:hypothetical protein [Ezakiella coagulans]PVY95636.1 hypothetical protein C7381_101162 [Ezakiella coagulans]